ncbi:hypothetical protein P4S93_18015 [Aneurinibacillus thermoaerophilus]|uniref:Uncharacterized protein n=1 Tax=Aneurinibacillus thermoaerophilus TaxID=143495 RepID=A0A1G8EST4_ANETH|nr:hypothetical protein [Aneurinibacillus thermoaerophilus]MED0757414.1 hypothetical protein [Aneurinibacillus thermoaerophilus]MED0762616.1 hypothetical protein [Aneurinibacillus thermoaerophilus]SDH72981.1 hypothetical protein SAMN04489735_104810 [Aneurinibacillus thermoaerophilus]
MHPYVVVSWIVTVVCALGVVFTAICMVLHPIALMKGMDTSKYPSFFKCVLNLILFVLMGFLFYGCATYDGWK